MLIASCNALTENCCVAPALGSATICDVQPVFAGRMIKGVVFLFSLLVPAALNAQHAASTNSLRRSAAVYVVLDLRTDRVVAGDSERAALIRATPGSTLKPFVLLDALDRALVKPGERVHCPRVTTIAGERLRCAHPESESDFDAEEALIWSCNTYFEQLALRFSPNEIENLYRSIGLTSSTGIVRKEAVGSLTTANDAESRELLGLGVRGVTVTPLELLEAYRRLALRITSASASTQQQLVRHALEATVQRGMARTAFDPAVSIAGKTGTSTDGPLGPSHGWFVGYSPADQPTLAVVAYVPDARGADAADVARRALIRYMGRKR